MAKSLSASLALESLTEQCERVRTFEEKIIEERNQRDEMIRDCRRARIPYTELMKRTGLSRDRLIKISQSPDDRGF